MDQTTQIPPLPLQREKFPPVVVAKRFSQLPFLKFDFASVISVGFVVKGVLVAAFP
jgi:hypothetical protein